MDFCLKSSAKVQKVFEIYKFWRMKNEEKSQKNTKIFAYVKKYVYLCSRNRNIRLFYSLNFYIV